VQPVRAETPWDISGVSPAPGAGWRFDDLEPSLVALLHDVASRHPEREAVVEVGGRRLTYAGLLAESLRVARGLAARGVEPGARVAIPHGNPLQC
jgi:non-ribosomal peptide synthetase component F